MAERPHIQNLSIWDCTEMEIRRDPENDCVDIICRGEDKSARLRITVWTGGGNAPVVKIDQTLFSSPSPEPAASVEPSIEASIKRLVEDSFDRDAFTHHEDMGKV